MNGQNAPENAEALVLMTKRISLDKEIVNTLKDGDIEKIKGYLGDEGNISEFAVALGYVKDAEVLDFVLKNANVDYEQEINALQRAANAKLTKLAICLIEECGADVNAVPDNSLTLEQRIEHYKTAKRLL